MMPCPIHTAKRHPSICRHCRTDERETPGALPLAETEIARRGQGEMGLEAVLADPPPNNPRQRYLERFRRARG